MIRNEGKTGRGVPEPEPESGGPASEPEPEPEPELPAFGPPQWHDGSGFASPELAEEHLVGRRVHVDGLGPGQITGYESFTFSSNLFEIAMDDGEIQRIGLQRKGCKSRTCLSAHCNSSLRINVSLRICNSSRRINVSLRTL